VQSDDGETATTGWGRPVGATLALAVFFAAVLFGAHGSLAWPMAWAFLAWFALYSLAGFALLPRSLIEERSRMHQDSERADLVRAGLAAFFLFPVTLAVCGVDARFSSSPALPPSLRAAACGVFVLGYSFGLWAAYVNPFFSKEVRIQRERGHHVVDRGPYAFVRHPGYAGPMLAHLALPLALGSLLGLLPALLGCGLLGLRAVYEERRLARELTGYAEYAARVRFRILPRVW
jgi:protein-S-isoprenylcysteine O-methyltransferase Ste14